MADLCGECLLLNKSDCKWGNEYYCKKTGKYVKATASSCSYFCKANSNSSKSEYKRSGWYITTAVCNILGYPDDCEVLCLLRSLRENYLKNFEEGKKFLQEYDQIGPMISQKLTEEENQEEIAMELLRNFLIPCSIEVKAGNYETATTIYQNMTTMLKAKYGFMGIAVDYSLDTPMEYLGKARIRVPQKSEC